jgi:Protein of unknown function (DUF2975)
MFVKNLKNMNQPLNTWKEKWTKQPILMLITVIIWSIFIGLCIQAGTLIFTFTYSLIQPIISKDLYEGLNLFSLQTQSKWQYIALVTLLISISILKAQLFYTMIRIFIKIDLVHPFSNGIAILISKLSYIAFTLGVTQYLSGRFVKTLDTEVFQLMGVENHLSSSFEYFLISALIFAIAQVFKRGVEIQAENELTV